MNLTENTDWTGLNIFAYLCDKYFCGDCPFKGEEDCNLAFLKLPQEERLQKLDYMFDNIMEAQNE